MLALAKKITIIMKKKKSFLILLLISIKTLHYDFSACHREQSIQASIAPVLALV